MQVSYKPRMADFAEVCAARDAATGSNSLEHYKTVQEGVAEGIVDTDVFLSTLKSYVSGRWEGTAKQLHAELPKPPTARFWPEARGMSGKLKRVAPDLRKAGWHVESIPADPVSKRAASWVLVPPSSLTDEEREEMEEALETLQKRPEPTENPFSDDAPWAEK